MKETEILIPTGMNFISKHYLFCSGTKFYIHFIHLNKSLPSLGANSTGVLSHVETIFSFHKSNKIVPFPTYPKFSSN